MDKIDTKSVFDMPPDATFEAQLDAQAEADYAAGRVVSHARVVEWLKSWDTPEEQAVPSAKPT